MSHADPLPPRPSLTAPVTGAAISVARGRAAEPLKSITLIAGVNHV